MGRRRRPEHIRPAEYDTPEHVCGAEYDTPNGDAWTTAGYGIGTCRRQTGHSGRHRAPVAWGDGSERGDTAAGEVTWE